MIKPIMIPANLETFKKPSKKVQRLKKKSKENKRRKDRKGM